MRFWLKFFKDKSYPWDFKIANFIMRDYLRNYLVVDMIVLDEITKSNDCTDFHKKKIDKIINDIGRLMFKIK